MSLVWGHNSPGYEAYRPLYRMWAGCLLMDWGFLLVCQHKWQVHIGIQQTTYTLRENNLFTILLNILPREHSHKQKWDRNGCTIRVIRKKQRFKTLLTSQTISISDHCIQCLESKLNSKASPCKHKDEQDDSGWIFHKLHHLQVKEQDGPSIHVTLYNVTTYWPLWKKCT